MTPRAADGEGEALRPDGGAKGPPAILWRVAAALTYLIPWIDCLSLGKEVFHAFPHTIFLYFIPGGSQDAGYLCVMLCANLALCGRRACD